MFEGVTLYLPRFQYSCDTTVALEKLPDMIIFYTPQGPKSYRTEEDRVEYLQNALAGVGWAKSALTQCYAHDPPWTFHQLYTAQEISWLQEEHIRKKTLPLRIPLMFFLDHNLHMKAHKIIDIVRKNFVITVGLTKKVLCWNCNESAQLSINSKKPRNMT